MGVQVIDVCETHAMLTENGYAGRLTHPDATAVVGRIDLDAGPVITLYSTGKALLQGRKLDEHGTNVRTLLRVVGWSVK
jgi:hypothetical protein